MKTKLFILLFCMTLIPSVHAASIHLWAMEGSGTVYVYANGDPIGYMTSDEGNKSFAFNMSDSFSFNAEPDSGWIFNKWCGDWSCDLVSYDDPFTGTITSDYGDVMIYFSESQSPTPTPSSVADIHLWKELGAGEVYVWSNETDKGHLNLSENSETYDFNMGDSYKFIAIPKTDWSFEKWCVSEDCTTGNYTNETADDYYSEFTGTIDQSTSNLYVYFRPNYQNITIVRASGEGIVNVYKNEHVNDGLTNGTNAVVSKFASGEQLKIVATPMEGRQFIKYCTSYPCAYGKTFTNSTLKLITNGNDGYIYVFFTGNYRMSGVDQASITPKKYLMPSLPSGTNFIGMFGNVDPFIGLFLTFMLTCMAYAGGKKAAGADVGIVAAVFMLLICLLVGIFVWWMFLIIILLLIGIGFVCMRS